jgi:hypothetical protein
MASLHIIGFRVDGETLARIQAMKPRLSRPWHEATTSDIVRVLLLHALHAAESGSEIDGLRSGLPGEAPHPPVEVSGASPRSGDEEDDENKGAPPGTSARSVQRGHSRRRVFGVEHQDVPDLASSGASEV